VETPGRGLSFSAVLSVVWVPGTGEGGEPHVKQAVRALSFAFWVALPALGATEFQVRRVYEETRNSPPAERIERLSAVFLGDPYQLGPLGEGAQGKYDRDPLWRFDTFDCTTYVETVLALAAAPRWMDFFSEMDRIRYRGGTVSYTTRNHFTDADWIPNNIHAGYLLDASEAVAGGHAALAEANVDKNGWYQRMGPDAIQVPDLTDPEKQALLEQLHQEGVGIAVERVKLPYVALDQLYEADGTVKNPEIWARIPSVAVLNIVRPGWNPGGGTEMNVSLQGWALRRDGVLYFRHASGPGEPRKVVDVPLQEYLKKFLGSPTMKGISLQALGPHYTFATIGPWN
jgi:hypothetical protein